MKFSTMIAGAALAATLSAPSQAQTMLTGSDTGEILSIARGYGKAELTKQSNGDPQISGNMDGLDYHIFFQNCTKNKRCEDINFYIGFLDNKPSLEDINDWNRNKRFSRAYLDSDDDACVEMDLDLVQGVSAKYLESQFDLWEQIVHQFSEHIGY
ncbi:YbjN domain-containing protein [Devosia sp. 2618]|uniref:YbjN domain-containing protein n=1 Tax=Devosia sp. 2618 TaxID=3156454 RepID=UPI003391971E